MEKHQFYKELPKAIEDGAGLKPLIGGTSSTEFISSFIKSSVEEKKINDGLERQLQTQVMLLDPPQLRKKEEKRFPSLLLPQGCRKLNAKQKQKLKLFEVPKEEQKYSLYLPLHSLWLQYMEDLLQVKTSSVVNTSVLNQKVLKADLHGCSLTVCKSKCSSYIGLHGLVIQETQNTFELICKDDKIRTIPKASSLFSFAVGEVLFTLRGDHIKYRPGDRSARKFKEKPWTVKDLQYE